MCLIIWRKEMSVASVKNISLLGPCVHQQALMALTSIICGPHPLLTLASRAPFKTTRGYLRVHMPNLAVLALVAPSHDLIFQSSKTYSCMNAKGRLFHTVS